MATDFLPIAHKVQQLRRRSRDSNLLIREGFMVEPKIIGHLNAATLMYQAAADGQRVHEASSLDGYRGYLVRAFGFEKGLERALARVDPFDGNLHARSSRP